MLNIQANKDKVGTKFQQGLADRIQMKQRAGTPFVLLLLVAIIGIGIYLSPIQWYWGIRFTIFFIIAFILRMETWKLANETLELIAFILPTLIMIGVLIYLYFQGRLDTGVALQIITSAPFSIILARNIFGKQVNTIAAGLREKFNN